MIPVAPEADWLLVSRSGVHRLYDGQELKVNKETHTDLFFLLPKKVVVFSQSGGNLACYFASQEGSLSCFSQVYFFIHGGS